MGKKQMKTAGRRKDYDTPQKELEGYPDVFADILNALVYGGKQMVLPENLRPAETETRYRDSDGKLRRQREDLGKYEEGEGETKILYLLANQTKRDNQMLLRKCGYVGGYYRGQYLEQTKDRCPVMELVLYWGRKRWKCVHSMRSFYRKKNLASAAWKYIDDEKLHVFEMRRLPQEVIGRFTSDMRIVLEYLADETSPGWMERDIRHPEALLDLLEVLSEDDRYQQMVVALSRRGELEVPKEGGKWNMCKLLDQYMDRYLEDGKKEGRKEGRKEGLQALVTTCRELGVTFEVTASKLKEKFSLEDAEVKESMALYW